ncbi:MAG: HNH endonuclease [Alphaproteobacteria bacterium]|nr:HNH endonuclease [Alphaproteobacteria bacterium]
MLTLSLGVASRASQKQRSGAGSPGSAASSAKKITPDLKAKIFERDGYGCRFCGFVSKKYQEIHFLNGNAQDHAEKNLVTACIFCHQCFRMEEVNTMKSGVLIWLPEIEQAQLHHIARAIYVARISQGPMAEASRKALDVLMERRSEAEKRISTDNPFILATVLKDYLGPKHYEEREKKLKGIRLFPLDRRIIREADLEFNQFPQILAYWRSKDGPFGNKAPQQWVSVYKSLAA